MIGKYVMKEVRDIGLAGFGISIIAKGVVSDPIVSVFAGLTAAGAALAAINRMPDVIAELNGGIQVLRGRF